jgi:hypothetical protein
MMDFQASMAKIGTERGLGLFLSKQIPCSCLDHKKNAKENLKTGRCSFSNSEDRPKNGELKRCVAIIVRKSAAKKIESGHKKDCIMQTESEMRAASKLRCVGDYEIPKKRHAITESSYELLLNLRTLLNICIYLP